MLSPRGRQAGGRLITITDQRAATRALLITMALGLIMLFPGCACVGAPLIMAFAAGIALSQHFRFNVMHRLGMPALDRFAPAATGARLEEQMRR